MFNFYRKWITDKLGSYKGVYAYIKIVEFVKSYNKTTNTNNHAEGSASCAKFAQTIDGEMCIAICDPLQRRVHKLIPQSGELMMMDNSNVDNSDTKIVHLMCLSSVDMARSTLENGQKVAGHLGVLGVLSDLVTWKMNFLCKSAQ